MRYRLVLVLLYCLSPLFVSAQVVAQAEKGYNIGVILPLSGDAANLGNHIRKGILLAHESLPSSVRERVHVIFEDDQLQATKTLSAYQKLKQGNSIDAVFVAGSGSGNVLASLAERDKVLLIAIGASDKKFVLGKKYVFTHWVSPESETIPVIQKIQEKNFRRIGIVTVEQEGANAIHEAFVSGLREHDLGDRIIVDEKVLVGAQDFKTQLAKISAKGLDGLCVVLFPGSLSTFMKQARELQVTADIFGYELFEDEKEVKASDGTMFGKWYVNAGDPTADFITRFRMKFGEDPGFAAGNAYDSLALVAFASGAHDGRNDRIADALRELKNYHGAVGVYSATGDNRFNLPAVLKVIEKDGFRRLP